MCFHTAPGDCGAAAHLLGCEWLQANSSPNCRRLADVQLSKGKPDTLHTLTRWTGRYLDSNRPASPLRLKHAAKASLALHSDDSAAS